jgi:hypothetical protein
MSLTRKTVTHEIITDRTADGRVLQADVTVANDGLLSMTHTRDWAPLSTAASVTVELTARMAHQIAQLALAPDPRQETP